MQKPESAVEAVLVHTPCPFMVFKHAQKPFVIISERVSPAPAKFITLLISDLAYLADFPEIGRIFLFPSTHDVGNISVYCYSNFQGALFIAAGLVSPSFNFIVCMVIGFLKQALKPI
jgi:hypothetical protein